MKLDYLKSFKDLFADYTELRWQENTNVFLKLLNGTLIENGKRTVGGVSARVYKDGFFGFASSPLSDADKIKEIVRKAGENASLLAGLGRKDIGKLAQEGHELIKDFSTVKARVSRKEMIDFLRELDNYTRSKYSDLKASNFVLNSLDMEKNLVTSFDTYAYTMVPRTILVIVMTIEKDGVIYDYYDVIGGLGQYEDLFTDPENFYGQIDTMYKRLREKAEGIYPEAGYKEVILDSRISGILAHEAIGHTTEADFVKSGSIARDYLNERVATEIVNLVDFAAEYDNKPCPVPVYIDDEGTRAEDVVIIQDGILKNYMNNKELALEFNTSPTGNARAYTFSDEPLVRMRNTAILPGENSLEEMIASIEDGYYFIDTNNGQADATSEFMFGVTFGYEIKNGKLGRAIKDTTISGVAFDVLKTVSMISNEMYWSSGGMCGKKQMIPVGFGGPAIKCKVNIGGK
ncbi:MAG TPA: TldD/PmbA family protein [Halanaerobiaceae bacterium]|nr:TldD/PmbA family protein [Bacillota bacterium]HHU91738.1 TldD/PmbA family protein [Halanaerobiaceae bacterium]HOA40286.1 TldD/PmbA family protein [Halanaerobiales bacterium]HPZ62346.1 TldD/PmbA family protein [Halanaerobiales bacterium]HQD03178.1 TldD/PmbA family protein [Halanaerobiales bacterium]